VGTVFLVNLVNACPQIGGDCTAICKQYWKDLENAKSWNEKMCITECYSEFLKNCNDCKKPQPDSILFSFKPFTLWSINAGSPAILRYHALADFDPLNPLAHIHEEGRILGNKEAVFDIKSMAFNQENGTIYFINTVDTNSLYKLDASQIDKNPATPLTAQFIGRIGNFGPFEEICAIEWINGLLVGISHHTKDIYRIDTANGTTTDIGDIGADTPWRCEALTQGADTKLYLPRTYVDNSEVWKIDSMVGIKAEVSLVVVLSGSYLIQALAGHPTGLIYAAGPRHFYQINPDAVVDKYKLLYDRGEFNPLDIQGMEFYRRPELEALTQQAWAVAGNLNPDGGKLLLYDLSKVDDTYPNGPVKSEGLIQGITGDRDIEAMTVDPATHIIYYMNNAGTSKLYTINSTSIDGDSTTPVTSVLKGNTGIIAGDANGANEVVGITFSKGTLMGVSKTSKKVYHINPATGAIVKSYQLGTALDFHTGGIATGVDGTVYLINNTGTSSELWKIVKLEFDKYYFITKICDIVGKDRDGKVIPSGKVKALGAKRDGSLYCADDNYWFKIYLDRGKIDAIFKSEIDTHGIAFRH
ncbi:MAG: hypothetical protein JW795_12060, partial [Chitinivibrionales bacterium]|nr:hypothetical protein [Chitinivibrionales bacterium]